jgi:beta-mannosidase
VDYILNEDFSEAKITYKADIVGNGELSFNLFNPEGETITTLRNDGTFTLPKPRLWWCNGYGEPALYRWDAILMVNGNEIDKKTGIIGFRSLELTMNEGAWDEPKAAPLTRSPAPITITLNGVPIFAKGSNWVNPEVFTGTITKETYEPLVLLAKEAHFNIFRCWGGAIINKKAFFDLCDEHGILVWQEFMLSCNDYRGTPHYLKILEQEARAIIQKLKPHPSLAIWCGGNELFNNWSGMTDQSKALRLLNKLCYELDMERPFLMTSPLFGIGHGNYLFRYTDGREVFQVMPNAHFTAYCEFGVPSLSNLACCKLFAAEDELFPMEENEITVAHHAFHAWNGQKQWACLETINDYFGEAESLEELIKYSQWMQSEGYKCIYEEARRQKPYCSMAINWCYNEAWPTLAPKPSYHDVKAACRPILISAQIPKFSWKAGDIFSVKLWLLNDSIEPTESGKADVYIELQNERYDLGEWKYGKLKTNTNFEGPVMEIELPKKLHCIKPIEMKLIIDAGELSSVYRLLYKG